MLAPEQIAEIRRLFYAEHWKVGTIAAELGLHPETIKSAVATELFQSRRGLGMRRASLTDPYLDFLRETLARYPRLRATRLFAMARARGYQGSVVQLRRVVARLRPPVREAFLRLRVFPGEEAQVDWAHFGTVQVGRARRKLSCFLMVLSYSRGLALEFFFDQTLENFLRGHVRAFQQLGGVARHLLYDNLRSAVIARRGDGVHFQPRLLELAGHYHFSPRPCRPARGNEKGRVERQIRFVRDSFFAARPFTTLADFNRQAICWRDEIAHTRRWPEDDARTVAEVFAEEQPRLLPLPVHPLETALLQPIRSGKTIYVRFDSNDYSIPPAFVGRQLTLAATDLEIRLLDGDALVACHRRSYDRHQRIDDPAHLAALLQAKRQAFGATRNGQLYSAAPETEALLDAAFARGETVGTQTTQLLHLLEDYGASEFRAAVCEALARDTPRASSVAFLLHQRHRAQRRQALLPVRLIHRPELENLHIETHDLETYDELADPEV